ncbi:MAG TPA: sigma 54-interacting transcriptional regulator [Pyrinomonadaceae bacterium]|jgi:Nif-specific regulatory protein|nr:sigma 54-interacting transcriptional regulator [Pyrinomonadaceae bacterium]
MTPKLIVIAGPLQGRVFDLEGDELSIGREAASGVRLAHTSVSRRHCLLRKEGDRFKVVDLDSFNGTFVNGVPVAEQFLEHGDHVNIGDLLLLFLLHEAEDAAPAPILLDEGELVTQSTMRLRRQDAFYLQPEKVLSVLPPTARVARDLNTLLKISTLINSVHRLEDLQRRLLELITEVVPAERGAILLLAGGPEDLVPTVSFSRRAEGDEEVRVSRTVALQALREGAAILSNEVASAGDIAPAESLITSRVSALMCVPLMALEKTIGVIYLDASSGAAAFDEHHLQLATAIAGIAATAIENVQHAERVEGENRRLIEEINLKHNMIGESARMRELYRFIAKAAPSDSTILLRGESGTGKELAARAIHSNSARERRPFVAINCATLSETLLESELFGHEKGAFTGAVAQKRGKLEVADGGTLFLDEVGEMASNIQAKFLRVLQEREFERVGGTRPIKVNVRVVAATNRDLEGAVQAGAFRRDLYYRLNVISFVLPPLRERREDIPLLANYFAAECGKRVRHKPLRVSTEARSYLTGYDWPGNVRELENVIERAAVLGSTDIILPEDLPEELLETASAGAPVTKFYEALRETKKKMLLSAIEQAGGNYIEAAKLLGIHPNNLHRLLRNMDLKSGLNG